MNRRRSRIAADTMGETQRFDLDSYLERIDYRGALEPTLATLQGVHRLHLSSIKPSPRAWSPGT